MGPESRRSKIFDWHLAALEIHAYRDLDKIIWNQSGEFLMLSSLFVAVKLLSLRPPSPTLVFVLAGFRPGLESECLLKIRLGLMRRISSGKLAQRNWRLRVKLNQVSNYVKGPCQA